MEYPGTEYISMKKIRIVIAIENSTEIETEHLTIQDNLFRFLFLLILLITKKVPTRMRTPNSNQYILKNMHDNALSETVAIRIFLIRNVRVLALNHFCARNFITSSHRISFKSG